MASSVAAHTDAAVGHAKSKWTRVASLGFLLIAAGMALWIAGGLIAGQSMGEELGMFGGAIAVALIGSFVVQRFGTVGKAAGIVLALLIMGMLFWVAFSLGAPGAFVEFSGAVMFVVGAFTAIGYGIASIIRRDDVATEATRGESMAMRIMLGIVALAMVVSAVLNLTSRSTVDQAAAAGATAVEMSNFQFEPGTFEASAGEATQFVVHNGDAFTHDFAIPALKVESGMITPGSSKLVEINAPAGEYTIYCNLHSDTSQKDPEAAGMAALLTVE